VRLAGGGESVICQKSACVFLTASIKNAASHPNTQLCAAKVSQGGGETGKSVAAVLSACDDRKSPVRTETAGATCPANIRYQFAPIVQLKIVALSNSGALTIIRS
jgi:hypothetical protein